jgi:hypothetical protein
VRVWEAIRVDRRGAEGERDEIVTGVTEVRASARGGLERAKRRRIDRGSFARRWAKAVIEMLRLGRRSEV